MENKIKVQPLLNEEDVNLGNWGYYDCFHVCTCGKIYGHNQSDCDAHRLHEAPHQTYPILYLRKTLQLIANARRNGRRIPENQIRDLIVSRLVAKGLYRSYPRAQDIVNRWAQDIIGYTLYPQLEKMI